MTPKVAVFTDTNLGTHIAVQVSQDIRAADFKRELKKAHFSCFPKHGIIDILALMVKKKSVLYHLPDTLLLRDVFRDIQGAWFISVNARSRCNYQNSLLWKVRWMRGFPLRTILLLRTIKKAGRKNKKKKKKKKKKNHLITIEEQRKRGVIVVSETKENASRDVFVSKIEEAASIAVERVTKTEEEASIPVSSIISKYFSDYHDMESQYSALRFRQYSQYKTPSPRKVIRKGRRCRVVASCEGNDAGGKGIGRRLLSASSNLRKQQKSGISRFGDRNSTDPSIRSLVFEISDDD